MIAQKVNTRSKAFGGRLSFLSAVFGTLAALRNETMSVEVDGSRLYEGEVFFAAVANGRFFGGNMMIAPHAEPADALFDVVLVTRFSRRDVLRHIGKIYNGTHLSLPQVRTARGRRVVIRCAAETPLEMDGEQPGGLDASFELQPGVVPFILPAV